MNELAGYAMGTLPVAAFLAGLMLLDSYQLVRARRVAALLGVGVAAALLSLAVNRFGFPLGAWYAWIGAPVVEESLKAAVVVWAVRTGRTGFLVDAAIWGCAVGAGFASCENVYYAHAMPDASAFTFVLRGFGTAVMHAGATAIVAILARRSRQPLRGAAAGLALAVAVHAGYNSGVLPPEQAAAFLLVLVPALAAFLFARSEGALRRWLGTGFDQEMVLLAMVSDGSFMDTPAGHYLQSLRDRFPPLVVADMLCMLHVSLELSLRAKGELLTREAGLRLPPDEVLREKLAEFDYLRRSIGATGRRALAPLLTGRRRDWEVHLLRGRAAQQRR